MKRLFILALILIGTTATAQNVKLYLKFGVTDEANDKKIPNVKITVKDVEEEKLVKQLKSDANGNVTKVTVPIQKLYWIEMRKDGWCTKTFYLDTRWAKPEDLPKIITFILDEKMWTVEDKRYNFMEEEPMREFLFTETGGWTWKKEKGIRADKKVKLVKLNNLSSKDADKFLDYMAEAEALEKAGKKSECLKILEKAKAILPSKEVTDAIARVSK